MEPEKLPALISIASQRLAGAVTSGELLEVRHAAQAALHYARVTQAANETQADCLRIIVRAEMRMADAIDAGQESGEVARAGRIIVQTPDNSPDTVAHVARLDELGVSRQRLSEWRELRDAGLPAVDDAIQQQVEEGKAPTKSGIQAVLAGFTGNNEWYTPVEWIERARRVFHGEIETDPASSAVAQKIVQARIWYDKASDGLKQEWPGKVWLNPPYARRQIDDFVDKLIAELDNGHIAEFICLTDNRSDTAWFHRLSLASATMAFTRGRIAFYNEQGASGSPANGSVFFYGGHRSHVEHFRFAGEFGSCCLIALPDKRYSSREQ